MDTDTSIPLLNHQNDINNTILFCSYDLQEIMNYGFYTRYYKSESLK